MKCKNCGSETNIPFYYAHGFESHHGIKQFYLCNACIIDSNDKNIKCDNCLLSAYKPFHPWYIRDRKQVYLCNACMRIPPMSRYIYGKIVPPEDIEQWRERPPIFFDARWKPIDKMPEFVG
jgi:hypothetical protein